MTMAASPYHSQFYAGLADRVSASARVVVPLILDWLNPRSIVDVGCGQGDWLHGFHLCGVPDILGIDGDYVKREELRIAPENFVPWDLTRPLPLERRFDLALSLEVAEHLPPACAEQFVRSLVALAPAVVFSAAVPGQGGVHHVNEQWPWYWQERFAAAGYCCLDLFRAKLWQNSDVAAFYRQNLFVYVDPAVHADLIARFPEAKDTTLTLVQTYILKNLGQKKTLWHRLLRRLGFHR